MKKKTALILAVLLLLTCAEAALADVTRSWLWQPRMASKA